MKVVPKLLLGRITEHYHNLANNFFAESLVLWIFLSTRSSLFESLTIPGI